MSNFFQSEIIQNELQSINDLQQEIYESVFSFLEMSDDEKREHIDKLSSLIEKQKIMYTRLSLSDDPTAIEMKENFKKSVIMLGFPPETDVNVIFNSMTKTIESFRHRLDK